jgi:hypothetical protein
MVRTSERQAYIDLYPEHILHYGQDGDRETACGAHTDFIKTTGAWDFVSCSECQRMKNKAKELNIEYDFTH